MLSRTADHLFWMARYTERAENTARMLDVHVQTALLPQTDDGARRDWEGLLRISELMPAYTAAYGAVSARDVLHFMVRDELNPSSIASCLRAARENARAVRGVLTTELWEAHNQTWLELQRLLKAGEFERDPGGFFEWVKFRSHVSRGVAYGTMLQDEAFHFLRLGTFLERADNTARMLDVKFHGAPAAGEAVAGTHSAEATRDFYHWSSILRSVSAFEIYRKVYRSGITPERVAELLILRADMPRSLAACMEEVVRNLESLHNDHSAEAQRLAGRLRAELRFARIDEILANGLHAFLTQFLERVNALGTRISQTFLLPVA